MILIFQRAKRTRSGKNKEQEPGQEEEQKQEQRQEEGQEGQILLDRWVRYRY
jgi:hypothetical protein